MLKGILAGFAVAACAGAAFQAHVAAQQAQQAQQAGPQGASPTEKQWSASMAAQAHVAAAMAIAKPDLVQEAENACTRQGPRRPALVRQEAGLPPVPRQTLEPTKIFDNLYYIGFNDIGAWALTTSQGIILIDSLNTPDEAERILVPGLQKVGLDPKQIRNVIVGHGHFDHFGGVPYLQRVYQPRVLMAGPDWDLIARPPAANAPPQQRTRELPTRDVVIKDGQTLTLGDATVTMVSTPGHTPGSIAILIPVKDRGRQYTALMLSGGFATPDRQSLAAFERALDVARKQKAVALLSGHPGTLGDTLAWMEARRTSPDRPNPFFYGEARFARYINIIDECTKARVIATEEK